MESDNNDDEMYLTKEEVKEKYCLNERDLWCMPSKYSWKNGNIIRRYDEISVQEKAFEKYKGQLGLQLALEKREKLRNTLKNNKEKKLQLEQEQRTIREDIIINLLGDNDYHYYDVREQYLDGKIPEININDIVDTIKEMEFYQHYTTYRTLCQKYQKMLDNRYHHEEWHVLVKKTALREWCGQYRTYEEAITQPYVPGSLHASIRKLYEN